LHSHKLFNIVTLEFYLKKREEYKIKQTEISAEIKDHEEVNNNYLEQGIQLVEILRLLSELYSKPDKMEIYAA
jgi:hypothetical protein